MVAAVFAFTASASETPSRPLAGEWEITVAAEGMSRSKPPATGKVCLASKALADMPEQSFLASGGKIAGRGGTGPECEFKNVTRVGSTATWDAICKGPMGKMQGAGSSTLGNDAAQIEQRFSLPFGKRQMVQKIHARRIGKCPHA